MKAHQRQILRHGFLLSLLLCALLGWNVAASYGQESAPKRGFQAGGSFALSDIESINTTNGNMMMHFPLASLPAGRGGLTAGINLIYSSKLYNSATYWLRDYGKSCTISGEILNCPYYQRAELAETSDGGWRYAVAYTVEVIDRTSEGSLDPNLQCDAYGSPLTYRYKLKLHFPDGSVHEMRPSGFSDGYSQDTLGDYYNVLPDGQLYDCAQGVSWSTASTISYYSTDGTYLRLEFQTGNHSGWWNNAWTLYLPDGTHVTGGNAPERIYDRNNNYVEVDNISNYQNSGHDAVQLVDQLNRTVTLVYNGAAQGEDTITSQGYGDTLVWKVRSKTISVDKSYWPCPESLTPCQIHDTGGANGPDTAIHNLSVVDRITLPAQSNPSGSALIYTFSYNAPDYTGSYQASAGWGELSGVTLPSGATASYSYNFDNDSTAEYTPDVIKDFPTGKQLVYRPEYDVTSVSNTPCNPQTETCIAETWSYSTSDFTGEGSVTSPDGGVTTEYAIPTNYSVGLQYWNVGMVYKSIHPDGSKTERIWAKNNLADYGSAGSYRADNPYVKTEFTSIKSGSNYVKTAIKDYSYDKNGNVTSVKDYDWLDYSSVSRDSAGNPTGIPSGATPSRITTNSYYNSTPDASQSPSGYGNVYWYQSAPLFKNAIAVSEVSQGSTVFSRTEFSFDNYSTTGNLTQKTSWDSTKGSYSSPLTSGNSISVSMQYNQYGMPTQTTDARGTVTAITYGSVSGVSDLYPTQTVSAYGTSIARTETRAYDLATGLVTSVTDYDNNVTTSTTHDVFGRPTLVKAAYGITGVETDTVTEYSDVNRRVIVRSDLSATGDGKLVSIQHYDQLGRVRLSRQLEDSTTQDATDESTGIKIQTRYLFSGSNSYTLSSNPYRASTSGGASGEGTMGWTRSKSDNTGRMIEMQTFGGSSLPAPWGSSTTSTGAVTTAYDANFTTVTDQAGKLRRSMTNGLGQLARVDEPDSGGNLDVSGSPAQPTSYDYDVLGNLLHVYQGSQTRTFGYSSLGHLITATNPESGTICYGTVVNGQCQANGYDANGNLVYKTDARGVLSTYVYDVLNRATSRSYSDSTPTVTYTYDSVSAYGKGRLASVSSSVSSYSYSAYDALGRALGGTQTISGHDYSITNVAYDRAGHVTSMTYPSNHAVTFNYDTAGRLGDKDSSHLAFAGNLGSGGNPRTYSSITGTNAYDPAGHLTQEQFGTATGVYNKLAYNSRGQLAEIRAGTASVDDNRGKIVNDYGTTDNNGNLKRQTVYVPNNDQTTSWYQQYGYDSLNRLTQVHEYTGNTNLDWQQAYSYDRWGNRTINTNSSATWGDGINNVVATIDTSNNRMLAVNDTNHAYIDYDAAGNQTKDYLTSNGTRTYDAENRMISATDSSNHTSTYSYDGDGRRVRRNISNTETWQVYGLGGELLAEYAQNGSAASPQKEYGYRNGQLLVTATATTGWGAAPTIHDNPLVANQTTVQALHITELRDAINALRSHMSLSAYSWQYSATTSDYISANPILEMRTALDQALGAPSGGYASGLAQGQTVKAIHIQELRDRVTAAWQSGSGVDIRWMVTDQLGTPRMIFDQSGSLANVSRHDYLPFGEELGAGQGSRTQAQGYAVSDNVRQKFTSKERDNETGLDYFEARYYTSMQGRFTSTDPLMMTQERTLNPQELNLYAYCANDPLSHTDPDGRYFIGVDGNKVEYEVKDGKIIFKTDNASKDLKRLAASISQSGSKKAVSQFMKLANNDTKLHLRIEQQPDKSGLLGYHQPHDKDGKALEWKPDIGRFDGDPAYITDKDGNLAYQEATITLYEGNIDNILSGLQMQYNDSQLTTEDYMVATFSHEGDHDLNQKAIGAIKRKQDGDDRKFDPFKVVEKPAYKVTNQVMREIKKNRAKNRN